MPKDKPGREKRKPRKPRPKPYLALLALAAVLGLTGCSALDWFTGADDAEFVDENADGVPDTAPAGTVIETLKGTGPVGAAVAVLLAFGAGRYVTKRRKDVA